MTPGEVERDPVEFPLLGPFEATALALWRRIGTWPCDTVPWDKIRMIAEALREVRQEGYQAGHDDGWALARTQHQQRTW